MHKNLNWFDRCARVIAGVILLFLSFAVFEHPVARLLVILAGMWLVLEGVLGCCPMYVTLGIKKPGPMKTETAFMLMVAGAQAVLGYVWWHAGWQKIWEGSFITTLPAKLAEYAAANPYLFMKNFLMNQATDYAGLLGGLIQFSQYLVGVALVALTYIWLTSKSESARRGAYYLSIVGLLIGAFMNGVFYFSLGHVNPWVASGNVVMFWTQLILVYGLVNLLLIKSGKK